ncbi:uncharacterized protein THITE_2113716 [Thermothielavioides terrestris NRRL 8126]|uniref:superoxide dismutase n=1 Tax=Thermothielavioides terrestris (strain ATCC 38088 / NRRL 8126) TaxID=578455 RepID=G2R3V2_THETT|nr:uncharacterized protein THITE_2113716 [Thermothielavioides terrestris NRRL 8126]AEO66007.1 hypothetical protein THITE_2113716 [Thermothielavioides terrestris NRRL 8126]
MRVSDSLSLLLAAAGSQVSAQSFVTTTSTGATSATSATPSSTGSVTGELGDATVVTNNPPGVVYKATFPESAFFAPAFPNGGNIKGEITAVANSNGTGVVFSVKLSNLPKIGASLPYHIHVDPVPADGNCTATLAHLDPFIRGETPPCDKNAPATCQVGDLSGKHGAIPTDQDTWETSYVDLYASTLEGIGAFFGNRSIVVHYPNKTRITCASFVKVGGSASLPVTTSAPTSTPTASPTQGGNSTAPTTTRGAAPSISSSVAAAVSGLRTGVAGALVFGAAVVFML